MLKKVELGLIALGANVAPEGSSPAQHLHMAIGAIATEFGAIRSVSRFFRSPAFPKGNGPDYVNAVVAIEAAQNCLNVLEVLHAIEAQFDRTREARWAPRTLDLDLLAFGSSVLPDEPSFQRWHDLDPHLQAQKWPDRLILPHPRIQDRAFVLVPLCDIAPNWVHPVLGRTATEMRDVLPEDQLLEIVAI